MGKTKADKKVNTLVKKLNKQLQQDVFKDRFEIRQYRKTGRGKNSISYYLYQLIDNEQPERNKIVPNWLSEFQILWFHHLSEYINNFIIESDFWAKYTKSE